MAQENIAPDVQENDEFPCFTDALLALGRTRSEQAQVIELTERHLVRWLRGKLPLSIRRLARHPELLRGLLKDAEARAATENPTEQKKAA